MKKFMITVIAIVMMMSLASCGTEHKRTQIYTMGTDYISVTEKTVKDGEVIEETHYKIQYESVQEAAEAFSNR